MPALPASPDVEVLDCETVWNGRFPLDRVRFRNRRFDGAMSGVRTWELWRRGRAAAMLPYDPRTDSVVLIEQFRLPALAANLAPIVTELPAGLCDGEDGAETTMRRESVEEIGLVPARLHRVGDFLLTPGGSDETCTLFVGEVAAPSPDAGNILGVAGLASENEDIRARLWPATVAIEAALDGRFPNSVAAIGLMWFAARRSWLRTEWGYA